MKDINFFTNFVCLSLDSQGANGKISASLTIAIKRLKYNDKLRNMMIAYEQINGTIEIVTIHPISDEKIINRITSRRWR